MTRSRELAELASAYDGGGSLSFRNRIINGDMRIDQRKAGASVTLTNQGYGLDRWTTWFSQVSKYTVQQNQGSVTPPAGFTYYQGVTSSSAYSVVSSDYFGIGQKIEGYNISDLAWGTASAKSITISFWVRSSLTGNFGAVIRRGDGGQYYAFTYPIAAANTWEYKMVVVPGPTTGSWDSTNGTGLFLFFGLGAGSSQTASSNDTWVTGGVLGAIGATSVVGTSGATFYITGVQLEAGTVATPFERRPYGTELDLCLRYFEKIESSFYLVAINVLGVQMRTNTMEFGVKKRATPTVTYPGGAEYISPGGGGTPVSFSTVQITPSNFTGYEGVSRTNGGIYQVYGAHISAEL